MKKLIIAIVLGAVVLLAALGGMAAADTEAEEYDFSHGNCSELYGQGVMDIVPSDSHNASFTADDPYTVWRICLAIDHPTYGVVHRDTGGKIGDPGSSFNSLNAHVSGMGTSAVTVSTNATIVHMDVLLTDSCLRKQPVSSYQGVVYIDGERAANGVEVVASINGVVLSSILTSRIPASWCGALYTGYDGCFQTMYVPSELPELNCFEGGTVVFTVNGVTCSPTSEWRSGTPRSLKLTCTTPEPTPSPTPSPTPEPTPSPTPEPTPPATVTPADTAGQLQNCPPPGKWAIAVWSGADNTDTSEALATCGEGAIGAAYHLDPPTGTWTRWFAGLPYISNLMTLDDLQGVLVRGG